MHGFPARLVTPGLYGFVGATKWLTRMEATTYAAKSAYWTDRGWATDAPILTQSRIDTPRGLNRLEAGRAVIGGVAWAQHRGIEKVEVRVDDERVAGGQARPGRRHRLLAPVVPALGRPARPPPADGARDRPQRRRAAREPRRRPSPRAPPAGTASSSSSSSPHPRPRDSPASRPPHGPRRLAGVATSVASGGARAAWPRTELGGGRTASAKKVLGQTNPHRMPWRTTCVRSRPPHSSRSTSHAHPPASRSPPWPSPSPCPCPPAARRTPRPVPPRARRCPRPRPPQPLGVDELRHGRRRLRPGLRGGPRRRRRLVLGHGRRPGRHRREQQPACCRPWSPP